MKVPKLHTMIYSRIHHNIMYRMDNVHKSVNTAASWDLSIHVGTKILTELDRWKNSCVAPLADAMRTP